MAKIKSGFLGERAIVIPSAIIDEMKTDELAKLLFITDIGFYPNAANHHRKRNATEAAQYILVYCFEGDGWFEIENTRQKVNSNQLFILPKGKAHSYGTNKSWTVYWIHFDGEKAGFFAEGFEKPIEISSKKDSRIEERIRMFEEIFSTLKNGYSKSNLGYTVCILFHFLASIKYLGSYRSATSGTNMMRDTTEEAIHYMRENISKCITLKELSAYVGLSSSHFSAVFKEKTGYSPLNYLLQLKIQEASHLLDFTDYKINQISKMIGFEDPLYFSRFFSKTMGISPNEYRKKKKG